MSITDLISEVDRLESVDRKRLMSHLTLLRLKENEEYRKELAARIDDKNPESWVSVEDFEQNLNKK